MTSWAHAVRNPCNITHIPFGPANYVQKQIAGPVYLVATQLIKNPVEDAAYLCTRINLSADLEGFTFRIG